MMVLVACEESQAVCKAFRAKGHEAFSCDLVPCTGGHPEWHILGDCLPLLDGDCSFVTEDGKLHGLSGQWNMIIAHPPCTFLTAAGNRYFNVDKYGQKAIERERERARAAKFFLAFTRAKCERVAIENPTGWMNTHYRKPDQIIHPYMFADSQEDAENYQLKRTCLWLSGLPRLMCGSLPPPEPIMVRTTRYGRKKNIYFTEYHGKIKGKKIGSGDASARSKTFPGIASAMAEQWG